MTPRNLSPLKMFMEMASEHRPEFHFPNFGADFSTWKAAARPAVLSTLGEWPARVDANADLVAEWEDRGVRKRRYLLDVSPHSSASLQVNLPPQSSGEALPAIQCWHGHGAYGKDPVMGNAASPDLCSNIAKHNYDYGHQMAEAGFITYAIDWMGGGERNDNNKPHFFNHNGARDWCNLYYLHATMFGMTSLSINLAHGRAATDFVSTLPEVDANRLGVMGLSGGGTMTLWTALCDERFQAAEIICYSDLWELFGIRDLNYCGMQVAPGLYKLVDLPDLQGLLAPLPLLIDIGANDTCFQVDNAMECFRQLQEIYKSAGKSENLELDFFPGEHAWGGNLSVHFFTKYLS
ncbi:MAG: alpha/beta hydrolase family protein [Chthoniobacterales bacterium]